MGKTLIHAKKDDAAVSLGNRLREAITQSPFNQTELAKEAGMGENTLSNYVNGKRTPDAFGSRPASSTVRVRSRLDYAQVGETCFIARQRHGAVGQVSRPLACRIAAHLGASTPGGGGEPRLDEIVSYGDILDEWLRNGETGRPVPAASHRDVLGSSMLKLYADRDLVIGETVEELTRDGTYALWRDDKLLVSASRQAKRIEPGLRERQLPYHRAPQ